MKIAPEPLAGSAVGFLNGTRPLRQVLHGSLWNGMAVVVSRFAPGILTVILARWLEQGELGVISFVLAYYGILSLVADWSIAYAVQKLIPENHGRAAQIAWTALFVRLGLSTFLGVLCWGLDGATGLFHGYGAFLAFLLIASSFGTIAYIHNARCDFAKGSMFSVAFQTGWLAFALIFVKSGMRITGPLLALCISFGAIGMAGLLVSPALRAGVTFLRPVAVEILRFGTWATLATLLSGFADQVGILVVAYRIGDGPAGIFKVATTFGVVPALLGMIVALPLMPIAKQSLLNGENVSADLIRPILRYLLVFGLPVVAAGFVLAPAVIRTFVREAYLGAIWPIRILLGASLLRTLVTALSSILFVGQGLRALARIHATVAAIALAGSLLLVHRWGTTGVAVANFVGWAMGALLLYGWFEARSPIPLEWSRYLRYAGSAALMAVCAFLATRSVDGPNLQLLLGGCAAGITYVFLLWIQGDLALQGLARMLRQRAVG